MSACLSVDVLRVQRMSCRGVLPRRASHRAAGYDLCSCEDKVIQPRDRAVVDTGIAIDIPPHTYARVAPRSGLALTRGIDVGAGVCDADFRGSIGVVLFNHSDLKFDVKCGDRIAQLIIERIETPEVLEVESLEPTARGGGGFGSTGR